MAGKNKSIDIVKKVLLYAALIVMAIIMLVPFAWMISASLKVEKDVFSYPIAWIPQDPQWSNYSEIWQRVPLLTGFFNSAKLTICVMILQLITSSFAAYAFAKLEFPFRNQIFMMYVMTIAIPWQVYMVPQFVMMTRFRLTDSHLGLILMHAFTATGVFLIRQFFMGIPTELLEAASSSTKSKEFPFSMATHDSHLPHASPSESGLRQLMVLAKIRAQEVFPTPLGPQNRYAWARRLLPIAFFNVDESVF